LRRHGGDLVLTRAIIGRALLLCAATTAAGFGSLAWSSNAGLASVGKVCASGIVLTCAVAVFLLPHWWTAVSGTGWSVSRPSSLYRAELWRIGRWAVCRLPTRGAAFFARLLAVLYWHVNTRRREVVIQNLLPVVNDVQKAERLSRELFGQFGIKVADLLRYECGRPIESLVSDLHGWDHFAAARQTGRGILLLTPHRGNWELGAPLLARRGIDVCVITLEEPDRGLTDLRQDSRRRWGVETIVIGRNPFAFVDVIRRLDEGGTVALLIDRPPPASAAECELFGRSFAGSIAAAELARASGCVLLPVFLPRLAGGYQAKVLPQIPYDRAALGSRDAREELTRQIVRAFEPAIKEYVTQWFHFVPIWPKK
jgi:KDO2-lipid IV(A) lauroyltransferase